MRGKKSRLAAAVAAAGACALLAACAPVKMGAAAIVGNDRITSSSLDSEVSSLQQALAQYNVGAQIPAADRPRAVLTWLVRFAVENRTAQDAGITVSDSDIQATRSTLNAQLAQSAASQGATYPGLASVLVAAGLPPDQFAAFYRWEAEQNAFIVMANGGKAPTTQAAETKALDQLNTADCKAAKSAGVQVNPQYGQLDYQTEQNGQGLYGVGAVMQLLSQPGGAASSAAKPSFPTC